MTTHANNILRKSFRNFWSNVTHVKIRENVSEETQQAIRNGVDYANTTKVPTRNPVEAK